MIRILHECFSFNAGGVKNLLMEVYKNIDRDRFQFDFLLHADGGYDYEREIMSLGGHVYRTAGIKRYFRYRKQCLHVIGSKPTYQIIHAHTGMNLWPIRFAKSSGIPIRIAHSHNAEDHFSVRSFFLLYERIFYRTAATHLFACSEKAARQSYGDRVVDRGAVFILHNGIDTARFRFDEAVRQRLRRAMGLEEKLVVGHVGRFVKQKNHERLIDIMKELTAIEPEGMLILIGTGPLEESIRKKVDRAGLKGHVLFLGERSDVNEWMQAFDLLLMPSLWEGLPIVGVEAQAAGLPVLVSDTVSDELAMTDSVHFIPLKKDSSVWAAEAKRIVEQHDRKDRTEEIRKAGYDIRDVAAELAEFYEKAVEQVGVSV